MSNQWGGNCGDITLNNGRKAGNLVRVAINSLNWGFPLEFYRVVSRRWRLLSFKLSICVDLLSCDYTDHSGGPVSRMGQFNVEQVRCRCWSCQHSPLLRSSTESHNRKTFTILISSILTRNLQQGKYFSQTFCRLISAMIFGLWRPWWPLVWGRGQWVVLVLSNFITGGPSPVQ